MTKTLTLIFASTALTAALGLPAWSALHTPAQTAAVSPLSNLLASGDDSRPLVLVDDDEDEDGGASVNRRASGESEDDEDECDDDEGSCGSASAAQPAPAGSVPPPQNGLFGTGTPQVKVK